MGSLPLHELVPSTTGIYVHNEQKFQINVMSSLPLSPSHSLPFTPSVTPPKPPSLVFSLPCAPCHTPHPGPLHCSTF